MDKPKKQFGGKQEGAGRKTLPSELRKVRAVGYVDRVVAEWVEASGGSKFVSKLLAEAHTQELIV